MIDEEKIKNIFGETLKAIRKEKGLSQEKLAELSNLHRTYISDVERGDRNISLINMVKLCNALNIATSTFFEKMEENRR